MKEMIGTAKTIEEATDKALRILGAKREEVEVIPLSFGSSGFLGFGRKPAQVKVTVREDDRIRASIFLRSILKHMEIPANLQVKEEEEKILVTLGEEASSLIGHHGNTLDALQYLLARYLNEDKEEWKKVVIDVNNYRDRREDNLKDMALKMADQVARTKRDVKTEPLSAPERRVIHMTLKENTAVTTFSIGEGSRKRVVIATTDRERGDSNRRPRRKGGRGEGGGREGGRPGRPMSGKPRTDSHDRREGGPEGGREAREGANRSRRPRRRRPPRSGAPRTAPSSSGEGANE